MDIPRKSAKRKRLIKRIVLGVLTTVVITVTTVALSRLEPAAPSVDRNVVWVDTVKRGPMLRQVRGLGSLVPEEILYIPAPTDGRVERINLLPGTPVSAETVLVELDNSELRQQTLDAQWNVEAAQSELANLKAQLERERLNQRAQAAALQSQFHKATLQADRDEVLYKQGLLVELDYRLSKATAEELANRYQIEQERLGIMDDSIKAQVAVRVTTVQKARALFQLKQEQVGSLKVRAGVAGVVQQLPVQVGQRVGPGINLAIVVRPEKLKAQLKVPETQAKDILIGQIAEIDTRNGIIPGRVSRIDPAVQDGTVTVDVRLEGKLPKGARPDLSVDGTIVLERLDDVVYVGRPAFGQANTRVSLFKVVEGGEEAVRVQVRLGRTSVNTIEVLEGLAVGDQVILSDMSAWDDVDRVRLDY
jgi:HlyD family secretion protein